MQEDGMIGRRFGRWTVVSRTENTVRREKRFVCRCDCGTEKAVKSAYLLDGQSQSCGCLRRESISRLRTKHGQTVQGWTPEYRAWTAMRMRCRSSLDAHKYWKQRGIKVCERWATFEIFLQDMGPRPSAKHSLDRIDVDGDYEPSNCRWATRSEQANNTTKTAWLTFEGKAMAVTDVAAAVGLRPATLYARVFRYGWPLEKAISEPAAKRRTI